LSQSRGQAARRRAAHRRPRARATGAFLVPTAAVAAVTGIVTAAYAVVGPPGSGHGSNDTTTRAHALAMLEQQRQTMIAMDEASHSLNVISSPKLATAQKPPVHHSAPASSSSGSGSSGGGSVPAVAPVDPGSAQSIAYNMLSQFGWSPAAQFGCLDNIWSRESGWSVTAENPSGAYGIPQALPGSKMASAGPDWQTDATTQIRWGLGYIQSVYGTPCDAWAHWMANSSY